MKTILIAETDEKCKTKAPETCLRCRTVGGRNTERDTSKHQNVLQGTRYAPG